MSFHYNFIYKYFPKSSHFVQFRYNIKFQVYTRIPPLVDQDFPVVIEK